MAKRDSFEDFLRNKQENEGSRIDWEARRNTWIRSVDQLYELIHGWLKPFINKSLLKISFKEIEIYEEQLGPYKIKRLDIFLGNGVISLQPKGTLIIGGMGRVDMRGPKGEVMIIESEWDKWKFASRAPRFQTWDFNEESFQKVFQEVTNGQ